MFLVQEITHSSHALAIEFDFIVLVLAVQALKFIRFFLLHLSMSFAASGIFEFLLIEINF